MKRTVFTQGDVTAPVQTGFAQNVMEGAPVSAQTVKAGTLNVSDRPHILARRNARWNRRASH